MAASARRDSSEYPMKSENALAASATATTVAPKTPTAMASKAP